MWNNKYLLSYLICEVQEVGSDFGSESYGVVVRCQRGLYHLKAGLRLNDLFPRWSFTCLLAEGLSSSSPVPLLTMADGFHQGELCKRRNHKLFYDPASEVRVTTHECANQERGIIGSQLGSWLCWNVVPCVCVAPGWKMISSLHFLN